MHLPKETGKKDVQKALDKLSNDAMKYQIESMSSELDSIEEFLDKLGVPKIDQSIKGTFPVGLHLTRYHTFKRLNDFLQSCSPGFEGIEK
jgi:hypothetical protein